MSTYRYQTKTDEAEWLTKTQGRNATKKQALIAEQVNGTWTLVHSKRPIQTYWPIKGYSVALAEPINVARIMIDVRVALSYQVGGCAIGSHTRFAVNNDFVVHFGLGKAQGSLEGRIGLGELCRQVSDYCRQQSGTKGR